MLRAVDATLARLRDAAKTRIICHNRKQPDRGRQSRLHRLAAGTRAASGRRTTIVANSRAFAQPQFCDRPR
jgi:hypothetical protein